MKKEKLRKAMLLRRDNLSKREQREKSEVIARQIIESKEFQRCNKILLYASIRSEVQTTEIYSEAKRLDKGIYYPKVTGGEMEFYLVENIMELEKGSFGIQEPNPKEENRFLPQKEDFILIIMPGAVFDEDGNRIGYGGGYYDKYLQKLSNKIPAKQVQKVGVAYACQMVDLGLIEKELFDVQVNCVVTENRKIEIEDC